MRAWRVRRTGGGGLRRLRQRVRLATKPQAVRAPLRLFRRQRRSACRSRHRGITLDNAPQVIAAGADLLAVISDLFDAPDIRQRARDYGKLFA